MKKLLFLPLIFLFLSGCLKEEFEEKKLANTIAVNDKKMEELTIPDNFTFETASNITLTIRDVDNNIRYDVYLDSERKEKITSIILQKGESISYLTIPITSTTLYLRRNTVQGGTNHEVAISETTVFTFTKNQRIANGCTEKLYAVNGNGGFYRIENETGTYETETLSNLTGGGSIACAVDRENRKVYYNTGTTLRYYDIDASTFHVVSTGNPFNGSYPRMEYNNVTGNIYIAKNEDMYIVNPLTNTIVAQYDIQGLESPVSGGDMAISLDGTVYMCCFSGLYRIEFVGNVANATRISADNLPFQPTSMAIDRNDRLYLATNDANSQLIEMDKFDGSYQIVKTYDHKINDLGSLPCTVEELSTADTDNDGVIDQQDDYPEDANRAVDTYTPSELGWGTLGYEDLWPYKGDFDFNDLAINYRYQSIANSSGQVVEIIGKFKIKSLNASYTSGFGIQLPFDESIIESVTGSELTEGIISLDAKGLEIGQTQPVIIIFDNAFEHGNYGECVTPSEKEIVITITFVGPQDPSILGYPPYNPFIFVNDRGTEVHLSNQAPTDKATQEMLGTGNDVSNGARYYQTERRLPWAVHIIHNLKVPKSGIPINEGYNKFNEWAEGGGTTFTDWYKDNSGYRNVNKLCDQ